MGLKGKCVNYTIEGFYGIYTGYGFKSCGRVKKNSRQILTMLKIRIIMVRLIAGESLKVGNNDLSELLETICSKYKDGLNIIY